MNQSTPLRFAGLRVLFQRHPGLSALLLAIIALPLTVLCLDAALAIPAESGSHSPLPTFTELEFLDPRRWLYAAVVTLPTALVAGSLSSRLARKGHSVSQRTLIAMAIAWPMAVGLAVVTPTILALLDFGDIRALRVCLDSCHYQLSSAIYVEEALGSILIGTLIGPLLAAGHFAILACGATLWARLGTTTAREGGAQEPTGATPTD